MEINRNKRRGGIRTIKLEALKSRVMEPVSTDVKEEVSYMTAACVIN